MLKNNDSKNVIKKMDQDEIGSTLDREKGNKTITFTGDVKELVDRYRGLQQENIKLKEKNKKIEKDFNDISKFSIEVALEAFKRYFSFENNKDFEAIKKMENKHQKNNLLFMFDNPEDAEENEIRYKMYKIKEKRFLNFLKDSIKKKI